MPLTMFIGFAGGLAVLASFAGVACGRLSAHGTAYHGMNLAGAIAMVAAGLPEGAWPSVVVNGVWALISARGLAVRRAASAAPGSAGQRRWPSRWPARAPQSG